MNDELCIPQTSSTIRDQGVHCPKLVLNSNMLPRALWSKIQAPLVRHSRSPLRFSSWHSLPARTLPVVSAIGINAPSQTRLNSAASAVKAVEATKRSRSWARQKAYDEAFLKALDKLPIRDRNRVPKAFAAAQEAQPINPESHKSNLDHEKNSEGYPGIQGALGDYNFKVDSPWGLALYRTAYNDEAAWRRIVTQIKCTVEIRAQGWVNMLKRHQLVIMDDQSQFDGATIDEVRDHFRWWSLKELKRNWRHPPVPEDVLARFGCGCDVDEWDFVHGVEPARYNYCLVVDDMCLECVEWMRDRAVVKLVDRTWKFREYGPDDLLIPGKNGENCCWDGGVTDYPHEEVGWMYMEVNDYITMQEDLEDATFGWEQIYWRPPLIRGHG